MGEIFHKQSYELWEVFLGALKEAPEYPIKMINIDGKTIQNISLGNVGLPHLGSSCCQANQLVLAQEKAHEKSYQIKEIFLRGKP